MKFFQITRTHLAAVAMLSTVLALSASPASVGASPGPSSVGTEIVGAINAERAARGLPALVRNSGTTAQTTAEIFLDTGNPHPPGHDWFGPHDPVTGPTIGREISVATSGGARDAVRSWMGSDAHRITVLHRNATQIRVGVACRADGRMFAVAQVLSQFDSSHPTPAASPMVTTSGGTKCPSTPTPGNPSPGNPPSTPPGNPPGTPAPGNPSPGQPGAFPNVVNNCFVDTLHRSMLDRPATGAERSLWYSQVLASGTSETGKMFASSRPVLKAMVAGVYSDTLGRRPDNGGWEFWTDRLSATGSVAGVSAEVFSSPESYKLGGGTDRGYASRLYRLVLGRSPDAAGLNYWTTEVARTGRHSVAARMLGSNELKIVRTKNLHVQALGRNPSADELSTGIWVLSASGEVGLAAYLLSSPMFLRSVQTSACTSNPPR